MKRHHQVSARWPLLLTAMAVSAWCNGAESSTATPTSPPFTPLTEVHEDEVLRFKIPKGAKVKPGDTKAYYLVFFDTEIFYLYLLGDAEPEEASKKRTELSRHDALGKMGREHQVDDGLVKIEKVSEVSRHKVWKDVIFLFQTSMTAKSPQGEITNGLSTVGFGSIDGTAVWFQHTGGKPETHPEAIRAFLLECEIKIKR